MSNFSPEQAYQVNNQFGKGIEAVCDHNPVIGKILKRLWVGEKIGLMSPDIPLSPGIYCKLGTSQDRKIYTQKTGDVMDMVIAVNVNEVVGFTSEEIIQKLAPALLKVMYQDSRPQE